MPGLCDEVFCAETTLLRLTEPFCQQHHISADWRYVNVIGFAFAFDFVEILAPQVRLGGTACCQQTSKVLDRAGFVFSRVFDSRSFFDLNHRTSSPQLALLDSN